MGSESKRVMLTLSETSLKRITEIGVEHDIMIESDWGIRHQNDLCARTVYIES